MGAANISIPAGGETHQHMNHQKLKTQVKQESANRRKGKHRVSRQGDQRDYNTEPHRVPTIAVHPTKTANKVKHQEDQKQTKRIT